MMRLRYFVILLFAVLVSSCHKKRAAEIVVEESGDVGAPLSEVCALIGDSFGAWTDVYVPVTLELEAPAQFGISGRATLVRDSLIHLSLRKMGMEVAVVSIDADSVVFVDKYHKMYVAEPLSALAPVSLLTVGRLQSVLLGRPFSADGAWYGTVCAAPDSSMAMGSISLVISDENQIDFNYYDIVGTVAGPTPAKVQMLAFTTLANAAATVKWQFDKAKWDSGRRPSVKIGGDYSRIEGASLINMLANQ